MATSPNLARRVSLSIALCAIFFGLPAAATTFAADQAKVKAVYTADEVRPFKQLARETAAALDAGKEKEMTAKITDLETAWDDKETTLKPKDEATWTALDKTLDKAISAIRSSRTDLKKGKAALEELIGLLGEATKPG